MEKFSFDQARDEAKKMEDHIKSGRAENYSEAEVLEDIEKAKDKLREIGKVFNIDTEKFSDADDVKFAKGEIANYELLKRYCELKGISSKELYQTNHIFCINESKNIGKSKIERVARGKIKSTCNFLEYTYSVQVEHINANGKIINSADENIIEKMLSFQQIFSGKEWEALNKLNNELRKKIKFEFSDSMFMLQLRTKSQNSGLLGKLIQELESTNENYEDYTNFIDSANEALQKNNGRDFLKDEEKEAAKQELSEIRGAVRDIPELSSLKSQYGRLLTLIAKKYNSRLALLVEKAENGDQDIVADENKIEKNGDETYLYYDVAEKFDISDEDMQKAENLDLPWSKYKQELGE